MLTSKTHTHTYKHMGFTSVFFLFFFCSSCRYSFAERAFAFLFFNVFLLFSLTTCVFDEHYFCCIKGFSSFHSLRSFRFAVFFFFPYIHLRGRFFLLILLCETESYDLWTVTQSSVVVDAAGSCCYYYLLLRSLLWNLCDTSKWSYFMYMSFAFYAHKNFILLLLFFISFSFSLSLLLLCTHFQNSYNLSIFFLLLLGIPICSDSHTQFKKKKKWNVSEKWDREA